MIADPLTPGELADYLGRIHFRHPFQADGLTLRRLHEAHITAIPFENFDTQLGNPPAPGADPFGKLVLRRRGGWCYEHNGLFARALAAMGFEVTRLSAAVMREVRGDHTMGSHLALRVRIDGEAWLADVGFGSAMLAPMPLREGRDESGPIPVSLSRTSDGYWRLTTHSQINPMSFDFHDEPADEAALAQMCAWQGRDAQSVFVQNALARRLTPEAHHALLGRQYQLTTRDGVTERTLVDEAEFADLLSEVFLLDLPEAADLWPAIQARHEDLFGPASSSA